MCFSSSSCAYSLDQRPHTLTCWLIVLSYAPGCRHHDPLSFTQAALSDLLDASWLWFQESHKLNPHALDPFLL
jgi:hypothetical protein